MAGRQAGEQIEVAAALRAEAEVIADQQVTRLQAVHDQPLGEGLGRHGRQRGVEVRDAHAVDAAGGQRAELVAPGEDTCRGGAGARTAGGEVFAGMGLEGEHAGRQSALAGRAHQTLQHRLVAAVDAIEVADGQRAGLALIGRGQAAKDLHRERVGRKGRLTPGWNLVKL